MNGVLNEIYLGNLFLRIGVIFRVESNKSSSTMIGYSDATVTTPNHPLIMWSKNLLAITHTTEP